MLNALMPYGFSALMVPSPTRSTWVPYRRLSMFTNNDEPDCTRNLAARAIWLQKASC